MKSMPHWPATAACQVEGASLPSGVTAPRPVTATLRHYGKLSDVPGRKVSLSLRWRPSSSRSCPTATGTTSRNGTGFAACSRTTAASSRSGAGTGGRCFATSRSSRAARQGAPAPLRTRRRDRHLAEGPARVRRDADAAPPCREPDAEALGGDTGPVRGLRHPALEGRAAPQAPAREAAQGARAQGQALPVSPYTATRRTRSAGSTGSRRPGSTA